MERRTLLKTIGGIGTAAAVGGASLAALSGGAAASAINISGGNPSVSNDRGDLTRLTADPEFTVTWEGLDDAVGKVFFLLEASVDGGDFEPIYRATPWLSLEGIGTTGSFTRPSSPNGGLGPLVIADPNGRPDYASIDFSSIGGVDLASFLDGTSMGGADNYPNNGVVLQNNFPSENAGYYGAAADTVPFDNENDATGGGSTETTDVVLRYTIELQRPNFGQLECRVSSSSDLSLPSGYSDLSDAEKKDVLADLVDGVLASDIDVGNSAIVMNGEDGYASFDDYNDGAGIPYDVLQDNDSHVGIIVETATLTVDVTNEGSQSGSTGNSNEAAGDNGQS